MSVTLTTSAAQRVQKFLESNQDCVGLRFGIKTTGCSGYAYAVTFAEDIKPGDQVFESHGVKIIVDHESLGYVNGTEIDFRKEGLNEAFHFDNPNVTDTCGCGESFTV
jgi:iron-sulfur cluster assembly protein